MEDPLVIRIRDFITLLEAETDAPVHDAVYEPDEQARADLASFVQGLDPEEDE